MIFQLTLINILTIFSSIAIQLVYMCTAFVVNFQ